MSRNIKVKPGKGQSMAGMIVGIAFCLIGLVVVVPALGLFGIIWTGVAAVITVINGMNAFSDKGIPTHEIVIEDMPEEQDVSKPYADKTSAAGASVEERLRLVDRLYEEGTITMEEREQKRKKILDEI